MDWWWLIVLAVLGIVAGLLLNALRHRTRPNGSASSVDSAVISRPAQAESLHAEMAERLDDMAELRQADILLVPFNQIIHPGRLVVIRHYSVGQKLSLIMTVWDILSALGRLEEIGHIFEMDERGPTGQFAPNGKQYLTDLIGVPLQFGYRSGNPKIDAGLPDDPIEIFQPQQPDA